MLFQFPSDFGGTLGPHPVGGLATSQWEVNFPSANGVRRVFAVRVRLFADYDAFLLSSTNSLSVSGPVFPSRSLIFLLLKSISCTACA